MKIQRIRMRTLLLAFVAVGFLGTAHAECPNDPLEFTSCSTNEDCKIGKVCLRSSRGKYCCDDVICRKSGLKPYKIEGAHTTMTKEDKNGDCPSGYEFDQLLNADPTLAPLCCPSPTSVLLAGSSHTLPLMENEYMKCNISDPTTCPSDAFCGYAKNANEPNMIEPTTHFCYNFIQEVNTYINPHGYCHSDKDCSINQVCTKRGEQLSWYDSNGQKTGLCGEIRCADSRKAGVTCGAGDKCASLGDTEFQCVKSETYGKLKKCCPIVKPPICPGFPFLKKEHLRECRTNAKICEQDLFGYCDGTYCCPLEDRSESARTLMNFTDAVANLRLNWTYFKDEYGLFSIFGTSYNYSADIVVEDVCNDKWECPPRQSCANVGLRNDPFLVCITAPFDHLHPRHVHRNLYRMKVIFGFLWITFLWSGATVLLYHSWRAMIQDEEQEERERLAALNRRVVWD